MKKLQSTSPGLGGNTQKLDAVVDGKLPNDMDYASISGKVIGHKLSNGSSDDLYSLCRMNFVNDPVQTRDPHSVDMGLPAISTFNESGILGTPATLFKYQRMDPIGACLIMFLVKQQRSE